MTTTVMPTSALDRARARAYLRLLPLLFVCYTIAYVDRVNVGIARLTMSKDMPSFNDEVIGFGAGVFFVGYFLLEIPGALIVECWSARKWISTIMVVWGIMAALTALVTVPWHFYAIRLLLGFAQAGFFPGITVYLTHWFPSRDRARALAYFFVATPVAQIISPKISYQLLKIGTEGKPGAAGARRLAMGLYLLGLAGGACWAWLSCSSSPTARGRQSGSSRTSARRSSGS